MQTEQALFLLHDVLLPTVQNEHGITRGIIEAIPVDKGDYRPDAISRTAMEMASHIVSSEMGFLGAVPAGQFGSPTAIPESVKNSADLSTWYADQFQQKLHAITALPGEQLIKIIDFRGMFQLPGIMYLNFMVNHSIHHRGQLSMYLRPMGSKVPVIYGESYDSKQARKAAEGIA